jgi:acyl dehydratase
LTFEDIEIGRRIGIGSHSFTEAEIRRFASAFDPQPFHIDEAAAKRSHFGGLIASGWHVAAIWMKLNVAYLSRQAEAAAARGEPVARLGPSPGFRNMVWARPVRPGDRLDFVVEITGKKASASRPGWGIVTMRNEAFDREGRLVFAFDGAVFWGRAAD